MCIRDSYLPLCRCIRCIATSIYLAVRPRIANINYVCLKKSEREDMEQKLGMVKGTQVTPNMLDRATVSYTHLKSGEE